MNAPLYFDYAATTPMDPRVADELSRYLTVDGVFGNPASRSHRYGWQAEEAVDQAREEIAELIHADPREIVFTSGATESDNLAIKGVVEFQQQAQQVDGSALHVITVATEHKAVLDTCKDLEQRGVEVTYLPVSNDGLLDLGALEKALERPTTLVSVMHVNNETGVVQDIAAIGKLVHAKGALLHVDAAQSVGKIALDVRALDVDLLSISGHKMYGPKGIGALFVRRQPKVRVNAQIHGGGHERGMRSGTLATHQIAAFGKAAALARQELATETERLEALRNQLWQGLQTLGDVQLNGHPTQRVAGILNVQFGGVDGELLLMRLKDIAVSTGSACNSASVDPSFVLTAMGLSREQAHRSVRFSVGRFTSEEDVTACIDIVAQAVEQLRSQPSPW